MALTALELLQRADPPIKIVVGVPSRGRVAEYDFIKERITILPEWAGRSDPVAQMIALHEARHAAQPLWWHLLRWIAPVRWLEERDAWEKAIESFADLPKKERPD